MEVQLNGRVVLIKQNLNILQVCSNNSIDIPRFCYHEQLAIAGNCRMCLVEVVGSPKPVVSCTMPATSGLSIKTQTLLVKKARENVMELLLVNHPLDCPVCDQGGECDLQDQSLLFGSDRGRFYETKRAVSYKEFGSLIKAVMTRCIHCTRCVRFLEDLTGSTPFGVTGRGNPMEIGSYVSKNISTELSGNLIDLCPVGALTSKLSSFRARSWELTKTSSVDVMDSFGSKITLCTRGPLLHRIVPELMHSLDESWISDKIRFSYDGFSIQRLARPLKRINSTGFLIPVSWFESFSCLFRKMFTTNSEVVGVLGSLISLESFFLFKQFLLRKGQSSLISQELSTNLPVTLFSNISNLTATSFAAIKQVNSCFFLGVNLRFESPLLLVKLRTFVKNSKFLVYTVGTPLSYGNNLPSANLGNSSQTLLSLCEGQHPVAFLFTSPQKLNLVFFSLSGLSHKLYDFILQSFAIVSKVSKTLGSTTVNKLIPLYTGANVFSFIDLGLFGSNKAQKNDNLILYSFGADEFVSNKTVDAVITYKVYQGHHGDFFSSLANLVFPGATFVEKEGVYTNYLGVTQKASKSLAEPPLGVVDWVLLNALYLYCFEYNLISYVKYKDLTNTLSLFINFSLTFKLTKAVSPQIIPLYLKRFIFGSYISDYFSTNSVSRASNVMLSSSTNSKQTYLNFKNLT